MIYLVIGLALGFALLLGVHWYQNRGPSQVGTATVVSKRAELGKYGGAYRGSSWNYLVTLRFQDGDELELYVSEGDFAVLKEGMTVTAVWYNSILSSFEIQEK